MSLSLVTGVPGISVSSCCKKHFSPKLCQEFVNAFVRSAAGVIAGAKPAALYSFEIAPRCATCTSSDCSIAQYRALMCGFSAEMNLFGIRILPISPVGKRVHLLVYRPAQVESILSDQKCRSFLHYRGFDTSSLQNMMSDFRVRLTRYHCGMSKDYPHEIGLVLGYPVEDVKGFIYGDTETCRGPWRAYGNVAAARVRFGRLMTAERAFRTRYAQGASLFDLLQTAQAPTMLDC